MKKGWCLFICACFAAASLFAQTRGDVLIYVESVADSFEHQSFFKSNFEMEAVAAGYSTASSGGEADYILRLRVNPNMVMYDDGTIEPAPPDEKQFVLSISVIKNEDDSEVITFSFPFSDVNEMYEYTLFLLYEAMANVPLTKGDNREPVEVETIVEKIVETVVEKIVIVGEESDAWRNKWLYLRASFDYQITIHELKTNGLYGNNALGNAQDNPTRTHSLDHSIRALPGATVGLELQFLRWMSTELDLRLAFGDPVGNTFIPGVQWGIKFPIKPGKHLMIEPYAAATFLMNTSTHYDVFPYFGAGGGAQFAVRGGEQGGFFFAVNYVHTIGEVIIKNFYSDFPYPDQIHWNRYVVTFSFGYKLGFFDHRKK